MFRTPSDASYLVDEERVDFYVKGDYTEGSEMDKVMKAILNKIRAQNEFEDLSSSSVTTDKQ